MTKRWSIRFVVGSLKQLSSNIHAYDVALCHFQDAFHRFSSQYPHRDRCITSAWAYPSSAVFESCLRAKTVSDQHVWDIVARWHGLRQLQHLYLIPAIRSKYVDSFCPTRDTVPQEADPLDIAELTREEMYHSADSSGARKTAGFSPWDSGRFYKALTAYWLATEILKLARNWRYDLQNTVNRTFGRADAMWLQRNSTQEGLNLLEVFDFVYGFLFQHIPSMSIDNFTDWVHEDWLSVLDPLHSECAFFLKNLWLTLSPPDVLELLWSAHLRQIRRVSPCRGDPRRERRSTYDCADPLTTTLLSCYTMFEKPRTRGTQHGSWRKPVRSSCSRLWQVQLLKSVLRWGSIGARVGRRTFAASSARAQMRN